MGSTSVILDSPNHFDWVLKEFQVMQQEQLLCDVQLATPEGSVSAHKLVLMATSPSMRLRLAPEATLNAESIHFDDIPLRLVQSAVHFMYTGKLGFETSDTDELLKLCEDLHLTSAADLLKDFIKNKFLIPDLQDETKVITVEINEETSDIDKLEAPSKTSPKKANRRVKQNPRKRVASNSSRKEGTPEKLQKTNSTQLLQNVLKSEAGEGKPKRGRPKKSDQSAKTPRVAKKSTTKKPKYVSRKVKKEKIDNTENTYEEITEYEEFGFEPIKTERGKSNRKEVNDLKNVIKTNPLLSEIKKEPEILQASVMDDRLDDGQEDVNDEELDDELDDEHENFDSDSTIETKTAVKKEDKQKPKRVYKKRPRVDHPCSLCDKTLSTSKRLAFHEYSQHGIEYDRTKYKMFHCPVEGCSHVSSSKNNMRTHTRSRHGSDRPHICEFCGKSFKLQNVLATHLNLHTGAKVYECKQCGERFNQHAGLDVHIKRHHMGESTWGELCHLCSEKFIQKSELCWHLFRVHNQPLPDRYKAYTCDECNFVTKKRQNMERHQNAHMGIKAFMCTICSKGCATKSELKRHVMYHGEKNFKCTFENCTYACVDNLGLQKHIQLMHTHKHLKPFICPVCKYRTGVKGNLDKHIRQVHNLEVVSKHTVPLKMKYKQFEQGDVITKDGQLVASSKDRKALLQQELLKSGMSLEIKKAAQETEVNTSIKSIANNETSSDQNANSSQSEAEYTDQRQSDVYEDDQTNVPESPVHTEALPSSSAETTPVLSHPRMFPNYGYTEMPQLTQMQSAQGAVEDLRMGLAAHLANSQLFQEGFQSYLADRTMEPGDINVDPPRSVTSI